MDSPHHFKGGRLDDLAPHGKEWKTERPIFSLGLLIFINVILFSSFKTKLLLTYVYLIIALLVISAMQQNKNIKVELQICAQRLRAVSGVRALSGNRKVGNQSTRRHFVSLQQTSASAAALLPREL